MSFRFLLSSRGQKITSLVLLALTVVVVVLFWLPGINRGISGDEMALVQPWTVRQIFTDPEGTANPPLQRIILNVIAPAGSVVMWGRLLSLGCALASLPLAFLLGRRVGGGTTLAGMSAVALIAVNPNLAEHATLCRSYALWVLVGLWHVLAIVKLIEDDRPRNQDYASAAVSAALLPWLHYLSVPILVLEALAVLAAARHRWRRLWIFLPAALLFLPLVPLILGDTSRRLPGSWHRLDRTLMDAVSAGWTDTGTLMQIWLIPTTLFIVQHPPVRRMLLGGFFAVIATIAIFTPLAEVRPPTSLFSLPFAAALIVSVALGPGNRWLQRGTVLLVVLVFVTATLATVRLTGRVRERDGVKRFALSWREWDAVRANRPIFIYPPYPADLLVYQLAHEPLSHRRRPDRCGPRRQCFTHEDVPFIGVDAPDEIQGGLAISFERDPPLLPSARCHSLIDRPHLHVYDCR